MHTQQTHPPNVEGLSRRDLLKAGFAAGVTLSALPLSSPPALWGAEVGQPRRGGILRVRGYDPLHFDPHLTLSFKTQTTLSFIYSRLVRHKVGADVRPGTFTLEPDLAERWEAPDDTTYVFYLRKGVTLNLSQFVVGSECDRDENLPLRSRGVRTGDSQRCQCSPISTNFAMPTPAMRLSIHCGGKLVPSHVPVVTATIRAPGACTTTGQASNATAAKPVDGRATTSRRPCWPGGSGHAPTGSSPPSCCACRARRGVWPESWGSIPASPCTRVVACRRTRPAATER